MLSESVEEANGPRLAFETCLRLLTSSCSTRCRQNQPVPKPGLFTKTRPDFLRRQTFQKALQAGTRITAISGNSVI